MGGASVSEVLAADIDHGSNFAESIWEAVQMYGPRDLTKLEKSQMGDAVPNAAVEWVMARNQAHQASNPTAEGK